MQEDGGERIHVRCVEVVTESVCQFRIQPCRAEEGMIHKASEAFGMSWLVFQNVHQIALGETVGFSKLLRDVKGEKFRHGMEGTAVNLLKLFCGGIPEPGQHIDIPVGHQEAAVPALFVVHFKVGHHLLKGQFKGIADIMEQGSQAPVLQEKGSRFAVFRFVGVTGIKMVKRLERCPEGFVRFINGKTQREHIDRMRIMIPVLEQQGTSVGFKLAEQFDHFFGLAVSSEKHFQVTVIDGVCVLSDSRIDEALQLSFKAEAVNVHLHIVGNLAWRDAGASPFAVLLFCLFHVGPEPEFLAAIVKEAERSGFQIQLFALIEIRLSGADTRSEIPLVHFTHLFQCSIHMFSSQNGRSWNAGRPQERLDCRSAGHGLQG